MSPLPEDMYLPGGWSCRGVAEGELSFARDGDRFVVEAERTSAGPCPEFDCPYAWSLTYQQRTGIAVVGGSIGFVTTREAAIEGLIACMRHINTALGAGPDVDLRATLEDVDLRDEVPAAAGNDSKTPRTDRSDPSDPSEHGRTHDLSGA